MMTAGTPIDVTLPGFADPVGQAQASFRAVLEAMARPGTLVPAGQGLVPPAPLDPATGAVLLTLVDHDTLLWLDAAAATGARLDRISLRCRIYQCFGASGFCAGPGTARTCLAVAGHARAA